MCVWVGFGGGGGGGGGRRQTETDRHVFFSSFTSLLGRKLAKRKKKNTSCHVEKIIQLSTHKGRTNHFIFEEMLQTLK